MTLLCRLLLISGGELIVPIVIMRGHVI